MRVDAPGMPWVLLDTNFPWMLKPKGLGWIPMVGRAGSWGISYAKKELSPNIGRTAGASDGITRWIGDFVGDGLNEQDGSNLLNSGSEVHERFGPLRFSWAADVSAKIWPDGPVNA